MPRADTRDEVTRRFAAALRARCDPGHGYPVILSAGEWGHESDHGQLGRGKQIACWSMGEFSLAEVAGDAHEPATAHLPTK
jgi:hypothetical protein